MVNKNTSLIAKKNDLERNKWKLLKEPFQAINNRGRNDDDDDDDDAKSLVHPTMLA